MKDKIKKAAVFILILSMVLCCGCGAKTEDGEEPNKEIQDELKEDGNTGNPELMMPEGFVENHGEFDSSEDGSFYYEPKFNGEIEYNVMVVFGERIFYKMMRELEEYLENSAYIDDVSHCYIYDADYKFQMDLKKQTCEYNFCLVYEPDEPVKYFTKDNPGIIHVVWSDISDSFSFVII